MSEHAITPIPEELKKLRLTARLRSEIVGNIVRVATDAAKARMKAEVEALAERVYAAHLGGPAKVKLIESLPDGWLARGETLGLALDEPGYKVAQLRLTRARPVPDNMRYGVVRVTDPALIAEGLRVFEQESRILQAASVLKDTLKAAAAGVNNAYALLTMPGAVQHVEPCLVEWLMTHVRKDKLPAVTETAIAAAFAKIDGLPDQPAS